MNIVFEPTSKESEMFFQKPIPASKALPQWYKDMPTYMDGETMPGLSKTSVAVTNFTAKGCSPLLDAMSAGYMFVLPFDLEMRINENGEMGIRWSTNIDFISGHGPDQAPGLPVPFGGSPTVLKWRPGWRIITPKGWSTLFTHPVNQHGLPFRILSGIVDTDTYPLGVEFPFQMLHSIDKEIFILEKGTPLCQAIPIKREDWYSSTQKFNEEEYIKNGFTLKSKIFKSYKTNFWHKKRYQ